AQFRRLVYTNNMSLPSAACLVLLSALALGASPAAAEGINVAQGFPADSCVSRRELKSLVLSGRVVRLRPLKRIAEQTARGEMINAELCMRGGAMVYVITILSETGSVVYVTFDAVTGRLTGTT